jgi:phosphoribosylformimino-5-aminoimidazole carboxamide ribonucleotide (ProFAR) isomerase
MTGGGIHNIKMVEDLLNNGINKIVVATNTTPEFLTQIPSNRLIVELSIN